MSNLLLPLTQGFQVSHNGKLAVYPCSDQVGRKKAVDGFGLNLTLD